MTWILAFKKRWNPYTVPNLLTSIRALIALYFVWMAHFAGFTLAWGWVTLVLYTVGAITDYYDGKYARWYPEAQSRLGERLDPFVDKVFVVAYMYYLVQTGQAVTYYEHIAFTIIFAREAIVALMRTPLGRRLMKTPDLLPVKRLGKHKAGWQMVALGLISLSFLLQSQELWWISATVLLVAIVLTLETLRDYVVTAWRMSVA